MLQLPRGALAAILVCFAFIVPAARPATPEDGSNDALYETIERGRQALLAEKFADAGNAFDQALRSPQFSSLPPTVQFLTLYFAAFAAQGREDYLGAHEFIVLATE